MDGWTVESGESKSRVKTGTSRLETRDERLGWKLEAGSWKLKAVECGSGWMLAGRCKSTSERWRRRRARRRLSAPSALDAVIKRERESKKAMARATMRRAVRTRAVMSAKAQGERELFVETYGVLVLAQTSQSVVRAASAPASRRPGRSGGTAWGLYRPLPWDPRTHSTTHLSNASHSLPLSRSSTTSYQPSATNEQWAASLESRAVDDERWTTDNE